jgi:hypothetical protein
MEPGEPNDVGTAANTHRRRLWAYGVATLSSGAGVALMRVIASDIRGHANPMVILPLMGLWLFAAAALFFSVAWLVSLLTWVKRGRPKPPFE